MSILWNTGDSVSIIEKPLGVIKVGTQNKGNGVYLLRAGTPLNSSGVVANTANAKYLVAEDFYFYSNTPTQPKLVPLIEAGYVDLKKAETAFGKSYTDEAKAALATAGVVLVDGKISGGGGGGGADWDAGSGEPGYIENRPFYEEEQSASDEIYSGQAEFSYDGGVATAYLTEGLSTIIGYPGEVGNTFVVTVDGTEYTFDDDTPLDETTHYPRSRDLVFTMMDAEGGVALLAMYGKTEGFTATVSIERTQKTYIKKLDNKYLNAKSLVVHASADSWPAAGESVNLTIEESEQEIRAAENVVLEIKVGDSYSYLPMYSKTATAIEFGFTKLSRGSGTIEVTKYVAVFQTYSGNKYLLNSSFSFPVTDE